MAPNHALTRHMYERLAPGYDRRVRAVEGVRREAVSLLGLKAGDTVLDIGCGTGLSFPLLEESVGLEGRIFGVDLSGEMLGKARERVDAAGWDNVTLVQSAIEDAEIPVEADAVLFHFTHDIMRMPAALDNVFRHVRPGGGVVSAGGKWAPWWLGPVNLVWWRISRRYVTTLEGYRKPWSHLTTWVADLEVRPRMLGGVYVAWGRRR